MNTVIQFSLFVSSEPHYQAEFWYVDNGLLAGFRTAPISVSIDMDLKVLTHKFFALIKCNRLSIEKKTKKKKQTNTKQKYTLT